MKVKFSKCGQPIGDDELNAFEREKSISLPADYREFLKAQNGGEVSPSVFEARGDGASQVGAFLEVGSARMNEAWDLLKWPTSPEIPAGFFPVAMCISGDYLCMASDGPNGGELRFWNHEECVDEGQSPTVEMLYFVAGNIGELLANLRDE